jgi:hypothetical protein
MYIWRELQIYQNLRLRGKAIKQNHPLEVDDSTTDISVEISEA